MTIIRGHRNQADDPVFSSEFEDAFLVPSSGSTDPFLAMSVCTSTGLKPAGQLGLLTDSVSAKAEDVVGRLEKIVASAIQIAFGSIADAGLSHFAVLKAISQFGLQSQTRILVNPSAIEPLQELLRRAGSDEAAARVTGDPLLKADEILLDSIFGRLHLGPRQLALSMTEALHDH